MRIKSTINVWDKYPHTVHTHDGNAVCSAAILEWLYFSVRFFVQYGGMCKEIDSKDEKVSIILASTNKDSVFVAYPKGKVFSKYIAEKIGKMMGVKVVEENIETDKSEVIIYLGDLSAFLEDNYRNDFAYGVFEHVLSPLMKGTFVNEEEIF